MHRLSVREKREFYSGMARLIRSGTSLPNALTLLARDTPRRVGDFLRALSERVLAGETLGDALLQQRPRISDLEASIVAASTRGGRLDRGCEQLARYFQALEDARAALRSRLLYPFVLLHISVFTLAAPSLFVGSGGLREYLEQTLGVLAAIYAAFALTILVWGMLSQAASRNAGLDIAMGRVPGLGAVRRNFALARFFAALDAQLEGGVNIWEAFATAARASDSGRLMQGARLSMPMLQQGERLTEALSRHAVIPGKYIRPLRIAEEAGEMDQELPRLAQEVETAAVAALQRWSEWLPKIVYGLVILYMVYQMVDAMERYYVAPINQLLKDN